METLQAALDAWVPHSEFEVLGPKIDTISLDIHNGLPQGESIPGSLIILDTRKQMVLRACGL